MSAFAKTLSFRNVANALGASALGLFAMIAALLIRTDQPWEGVLHTSAKAWEEASALSFLFLFAAGAISGLITKGPIAPFVGICCLGAYPIIALIDIIRDPTAHNLWPIEFVLYAVTSIIPLLGSLVVGSLRSRLSSAH